MEKDVPIYIVSLNANFASHLASEPAYEIYLLAFFTEYFYMQAPWPNGWQILLYVDHIFPFMLTKG